MKKLIKELAEIWQTRREAEREQREKHRIEYAFTSGGRKYYRFADIANLPYQRGRAALNAYNEVEMRCDRDFLLRYTRAVDDVLTRDKIDIYQVKQLNDMLRDRLTLTADMDLCYKLAAAVYFDKTERPEIYEEEYAKKKIERWRREQSATDFFLQKPLMELMPFLRSVEYDLDTYTALTRELGALQEQMMRSASSIVGRTSTTAGKP